MDSQSAHFKDDATATYRGYRRQALYCLYRLLDDGLPNNFIVQPEGNEDLAIYDHRGELLEIVQVKDYTANLTISTFKPSFFRRISAFCSPGSTVAVKIASFGQVGPELAMALDDSHTTPTRALETLTKDREVIDANGNTSTIPGLSIEQAHNVFSHIELELVDEDTLTTRILAQLQKTITSGDPLRAFDNLMWWLVSSAEKQRRLSRLQAIETLSQLGRFLTYRAAHEHEWNVSIKPIQELSADSLDKETLRRDFFQGGRVRTEHIAARLDVPRLNALNELHTLFQQDNVVIVRAASGQGKTTLAYRYLLDWAPADFRYEVLQAADFQHARRMSAAIAGHAEAIRVPTIVYVDVRPGDSLWVEFVRELAGVKEIRVLVTIREEDWFRSRVTKDDFSFVDMPLSFTSDTARIMFDALRDSGLGTAQLDFNDAWAQLGDRKTLFEFVFLTTQNANLTEKLKAQIATLQDQVNAGSLSANDLHLLRLVAVASAYEARVSLVALAHHVGIPEPTRTLERFSNEYLLRLSEDRTSVEGFHAIRSEIIAIALTDEELQPRGLVEATVARMVVEEDLEIFLLASFSRNTAFSGRVIRELTGLAPSTWVGIRGICVALQWLGLKHYAEANSELIVNVRAAFGAGWWFVLDWDLAQASGKEGYGFLEALRHTSKEIDFAATSVPTVRAQQTNKNEVFSYAREWLRSFSVPANEPDHVDEFHALAEVLYWMGHLQIENRAVAEWLPDEVIGNAWTTMPLHLFAVFAVAVRTFASLKYERWLHMNRTEIESQLRKRCSIIALIEEENCLVAHFAIDLDKKASTLTPADTEASVNDLSYPFGEPHSVKRSGCVRSVGRGGRVASGLARDW